MQKSEDWRTLLANGITNPQELLQLLDLDPVLLNEASSASQSFPLRVPKGFVARMKKGDPHDPLLRQVLPLGIELLDTPGYEKDPLQENKKNPIPALLHKFSGRILLIVTGACAVHCRYCFRRHFPYTDNSPGEIAWQKVIHYIENDVSISEVIFSGGDPLVATDAKLQRLVTQLEAIPHVKRLRIHTRMPIVLPERISSDLLTWISHTRLKTTVVVHCNHAQELNGEVKLAIAKLLSARVTVLNQSVLLKGINDNVDTLVELSETLFDYGILPYYLFLLDKVQGAAHFDMPYQEAVTLYRACAARLPGYLLPKLSKEAPGAPAKLIMPISTFLDEGIS